MTQGPRRHKQPPCPRCGRPADPTAFPFCSERCRLIDLAGWFGEAYTITTEESAAEEEADYPDLK